MRDTYINRELSLLEFHKRVLAQAEDDSIPLLERVRFLCISCTNLDEFFEIRISGLKQRMEIGAPAQGPENVPAQVIMDELRVGISAMVDRQYRLLNSEQLPQLADAGIRYLHSSEWDEKQRKWLHEFSADVRPGPAVSACTQQKPKLHRTTARQGCVRAAAPSRHGAGTPVAAAHH